MKKTHKKLISTGLTCTALFGFIGCSDMLSKFDSIYWNTTYTVRHLFQELNRDGDAVAEGRYAEDTYERETLPNPVPNTLSEAKAKEIPGFTPQPFEQVIVNGDGSTTVDIYYDRNPVTLTFDPNGGYFVDSKTSQRSENSIEITQVYGTTVSFRNPKFEGSDTSLSIDFYNWVPVDTATTLKTTGGDFISFPIPSTSGKYRALWDFSTSVGNISNALSTMPASGGKLTLTGEANSADFSRIATSITNLENNPDKKIELDLRKLEIAEDEKIKIELFNATIRNNLALTKVELPVTGEISLGENALKMCSNLEYISIGKNVQIADTNPFWGCYKVEFDVASDHPTLVASKDKRILLKRPQNDEEGYTLVSYPSATGVVDLGALGYPITTIGKEALAFIPKGETTIIFPESVKIIKESAVSQDTLVQKGTDDDNESPIVNKLTVIMEGKTPPTLRTDEPGPYKGGATFYSGNAPSDPPSKYIVRSETRIYVPEGSVETYKKTAGWDKYEIASIPSQTTIPNKH